MMPSTTVWMIPIWSATVAAVNPSASSAAWIASTCCAVASGANRAVARIDPSDAVSGWPMFWVVKSSSSSA
jgi:hypothetical protein